MRNIVVLVIVVACYCGVLFAAKPLESLSRYNVVLVHGAAPEGQGFESLCDATIKDAWNTRNDHSLHPKDSSWNLGDAVGMLGKYEDDGEKKLTLWLDSVVFEDTVTYGSEYIYIQRSFANPAASPAHNAHEIGDRTWMGNNNCSVRRSLFEEAQEVRAGGQDSLRDRRLDSVTYSYRTIPSRNILIAHSMGGVASHEYVTDQSVYNNDVDKMIALDSPHEGTGSLNMLLDMRDYGRQYAEAQTQYMLMSILGMSECAISGDPYTATNAIWLLVPSLGLSVTERLVTWIVDISQLKDDYGFKEEDPLTSYIEPDAPGISALINRPFNENLPMIRLLAGKGGLTFSDPNKGFRNFLNIFIPEAVSTTVMNIAAQARGDGSASAIYTNIVTGLSLGIAGGIALQDVGTTLIPESSGLAENTKAFTNPNADVETSTFDAAAYANDASMAPIVISNVATLAATVAGIVGVHYALAAFPYAQIAAKAGIAVVGAALLALELGIAKAGIEDLVNSHENAKARRMLDTLYSGKFSYPKVLGGNETGDVRVMENFLYEKPFVNLALFLSDSVLRSVDPGCYYEADDLNKLQLCEVGLYGSRDSVVIDPVTMKETHIYNAAVAKADSAGNVVHDSSGNIVYDSVYYGTFEQRNYAEFRKSPLKFKAESDWYKVGVKVDRWERVDGLKPNGDPAPKGVPIRHVERYSVPDIVATGFIEKYFFVVDDLMPHRMRQIKMTFNSNDEVAWDWPTSRMLQKMLVFSIAEA